MRILHVASASSTLELFVKPLQVLAESDGFRFDYLDSSNFRDHPILRRGIGSVCSWRFQAQLRDSIDRFEAHTVVIHTPSTAVSLRPVLQDIASQRVFVSRGGFNEGRGRAIAATWAAMDPARWACWERVAVLNEDQAQRLKRLGIKNRLLPLGGLNLEQPHAPSSAPTCFTLGWVGRFDVDKRLKLFLQLVSRLFNSGYSFRGLVVGDVTPGDRGQVAQLKHAARHLPIVWTGWVEGVEREYERMSLLVSTSRREGYGRAIIEAARAGVPTVGFSTEGTRQSIGDAAGITIQSGNLNALVAACEHLISSEDAYFRLRRRVLDAARQLSEIDVWRVWREFLS